MLINKTSIMGKATCTALQMYAELFAKTGYLNKDFGRAF